MKLYCREIPERNEVAYYMWCYDQQEEPRTPLQRFWDFCEAFIGGYLVAVCVMWLGALI